MSINRLSPIIYDQLTGDKIFAGAQLYLYVTNYHQVQCIEYMQKSTMQVHITSTYILLISLVLNVVSCFCELQKKAC